MTERLYKNEAKIEFQKSKRSENIISLRKTARGNLINRRRKLETFEDQNGKRPRTGIWDQNWKIRISTKIFLKKLPKSTKNFKNISQK